MNRNIALGFVSKLENRKKGTGPFCAKHRALTAGWSGRSGKRVLSPFSLVLLVLRQSLVLAAFIGIQLVQDGLGKSGVSGATVNFESLTLHPDSFNNGDPGGLSPGDSHDGTFVLENATFNNMFAIDATFNFPFWSGWSYSNVSDTTTAGFTNQYAAITGSDFSGNGIYGIAFVGGFPPPTVVLPPSTKSLSARITNTTYTHFAVVDGNDGAGFARQFGDDPNNGLGHGNEGEPDFLLLTVTGRNSTGGSTGTVDFYLADYRFSDNQDDFAISTWELVDLSGLGSGTRRLEFSMTTTDVGNFGANTPFYFAFDELELLAVPEPSNLLLFVLGVPFLISYCYRQSFHCRP